MVIQKRNKNFKFALGPCRERHGKSHKTVESNRPIVKGILNPFQILLFFAKFFN